MTLWTITRLIREEYEVECNTRNEAIEICQGDRTPGPHTITIMKEKCKKTRKII